MRTILFSLTLFLLSASPSVQAQISTLNQIKNPTLDELRQTFKSPSRDYSTGPLWTWNDRLTEEQVRSTLRDLAKQHVKQVWVHPRPGLMTPYLSDEWFDLWRASLDEAEKLDMNVWIYDENSYPSGFAGGFVPEALPDSRGKGLRFREIASLNTIDTDIQYIFEPTSATTYRNITTAAKAAGNLPPLESGRQYLLAYIQYAPSTGWFGGWWYPDLLQEGVTEKFIEVTNEAYKREVGEHFGNRIPGIFTDEPKPPGAYVGTWITWNEEIPVLFEERFGYSLINNLPSLYKEVGNWKRVRHNLHALILHLFIERWARPNFEWTEAHGLEWTGHYWEHGWPGTLFGPDNMAMYVWHQRPGIDMLMNLFDDSSPNALGFGNIRIVKELASVANQMGRSRTFSETYGAGGWDMRFEDFKRYGDWAYALGVNTNNEHLSYVTIRGARKRDHPPSFSYHAPWFEGYHVLADHFTRLSYMLSQGRQINRVVVIQPTTTAWMYQSQTASAWAYQGEAKLQEIGRNFTDLVNALTYAQVEYDLASEDTIARFGRVEGTTFFINYGEYDLVILAPNTENLNTPTAELLMQYVLNGGRLLCAGELPSLLDGAAFTSDEAALLRSLLNLPNVAQVSVAEAVAEARERSVAAGLSITVPEGTRTVFHHRRQLPDSEILFICNIDMENSVIVSFDYPPDFDKYMSKWDMSSGKIWGSMPQGSRIVAYTIPPSGSVLFVLTNSPITGDVMGAYRRNAIEGSETTIQRLEPNVLTLDYVDVKVGNEERKDIYAWQANRWVYTQHGFEAGNPWDNQVQFRDELITRAFPEGSGFEATYRFTIEESVANDLAIVIERPDLYAIYVNDTLIREPGTAHQEWWLDKSFGKIDISRVAKTGENTVRIVASPMTIEHELEPAYLLGDFSLRSADKGFVVGPPQPLALRAEVFLGEWHSDELEGVAWLSAGVGFNANRPDLLDRSPTLVFQFAEEQSVEAIRIWNYNERNHLSRGVREVEITGLGRVTLPIGTGFATDIPFAEPTMLQRVEFKILSNHAGTIYPVPENVRPGDAGFVGLAEVQFLVRIEDGRLVPIQNVTATASSELVFEPHHDRRARYLVDGSGLGQGTVEQGWHLQGMPFYSGKVEYSRNFEIANVADTYHVRLPNSPAGWYGATARIFVNGNDAGFVKSPPWTVNVTEFIQPGSNEVSVQVYGTPKNLLGPHHIGRLRGIAGPGHFHHAPRHQPPGAAYDVIGYGLFEPFTLMNVQ